MTNNQISTPIVPSTDLERELLTRLIKDECLRLSSGIKYQVSGQVDDEGYLAGGIKDETDGFDVMTMLDDWLGARFYAMRHGHGGLEVAYITEDGQSNYVGYAPMLPSK